MTPTRQTVLFLLAGVVSFSPFATVAQQSADPQQSPAPIVRVPQHPRTAPADPNTPRPAPARVAPSGTPSAGAPAEAAPLVRRPRTGVQAAPPEAAPPVHRPAPATTPGTATTQTAQPATAAASSASSRPAQSASGTQTFGNQTSATEAAPAVHKPAAPPVSVNGLNRNIIVLDASHGGTDSGARIGDTTLEKNVTLAFAFRLRSLLVARGFTVVLTREADAATEATAPGTALTLDDRAGMANHARAAACLLLHATGRGTGVHLYSSELEPTTGEPLLSPWLTAQSPWVPASQALERQLGAALGRSHIALVSSAASVRPVDSLTCPALALELAPETDKPASINDAGYQERVAAAVAGALVFWENAVQPPVRLPAPTTPHLTATHALPSPPAPETTR